MKKNILLVGVTTLSVFMFSVTLISLERHLGQEINTYTYFDNRPSVRGNTLVESIPLEDLEPLASSTVSYTWSSYPETIFPCTRSGDDLLVLVNKKYQLPSTYVPTDLVLASSSGIRRGENYYLRSILMDDLKEMVSDIRAEGIDLSIISACRSYATQQATYDYWMRVNGYNTELVDTFSARPGHSQHQLGTAIDFSSSEIDDGIGGLFANTRAGVWLAQNAYRYGFVISYPLGSESITGYKYESWHYRYIGKENALDMHNRGMILETYLMQFL